ncbi:hypothetical protein GQ457_18G012280 [Hibiscus cannabinus]
MTKGDVSNKDNGSCLGRKSRLGIRSRQSVLLIIFFAHGLEIQLWQSSRPHFDTLSVQAYSEKYVDPIALYFVFLVQACLGRDLGKFINSAPGDAIVASLASSEYHQPGTASVQLLIWL